MTELLDEKMRVAKIVLEKLSNYPMRRTPLEKAVLKESPTPWQVTSILEWLRNRNLMAKMGPPRSTAPYKITEKGIMFLKILQETYKTHRVRKRRRWQDI